MLEQTERIFNDLALNPIVEDRNYEEATHWNDEVYNWSNQVSRIALSFDPELRKAQLTQNMPPDMSHE